MRSKTSSTSEAINSANLLPSPALAGKQKKQERQTSCEQASLDGRKICLRIFAKAELLTPRFLAIF